MRKLFLTYFYSGLLPKAPGTWGTLAGLVSAWFVVQYFGYQTLFLATIFITLISFKEIDRYEAEVGEHDSKEIVIDEVVGIWLSLCITGATTLVYFALNFVFFRVFDIWKPSVIGRIDRDTKGGYGVMGDDLLAGVFGAICSGGVYMLVEPYLK